MTYLFVCVHNAGRSQMAAAFVDHYASLHGLSVKGESAGTRPATVVNLIAVAAMREVGIELGSNVPKLLTSEMAARAAKSITMGCGVEGECPSNIHISEDWQLPDPAGQSIEKVREIRDAIDCRVKTLLGLT